MIDGQKNYVLPGLIDAHGHILELGKWADFILLDQDVFAIPATKLWQVKVLQTWVGGELKYP